MGCKCNFRTMQTTAQTLLYSQYLSALISLSYNSMVPGLYSMRVEVFRWDILRLVQACGLEDVWIERRGGKFEDSQF